MEVQAAEEESAIAEDSLYFGWREAQAELCHRIQVCPVSSASFPSRSQFLPLTFYLILFHSEILRTESIFSVICGTTHP